MSDEQATRRLGRVVGKYTLERVLGAGGMSTVYEASHRNGNRVAVKMLKPAYAVTSEVRARFLREGYAANRVRHPGAVRVLDDDVTSDGLVFLVMELLEGSTLDALAKARGGKLSVSLALTVGRQLLEVLAAAHEAGIVHRDVKPENVFVQTNGKLKVLDFGIARILSARDGTVTTTGRMLGTPAFMPPEQAYGRRDEVDARSDLWSVGATLFSTMTGRVVHEADTAEETLIKAATEPAPSLAARLDDVAVSVVTLVDRALRADKAARFSSAAEMLDALDRAHEEAFGAPVPTSIPHELTAVAAADVAPAPPRRRALRLAAFAVPIGLLVALVLAGASVHGEATVARAEEPAAAPSALAAIAAPAATTAAATAAPVLVPVLVPEPLAAVASDTRSAPSPASRAPLPRERAAAPPESGASDSGAPGARSCGFELDEEGRKWPKRCP